MSLIPTIWTGIDVRSEGPGRMPPIVYIQGDPTAAHELMPLFQAAYVKHKLQQNASSMEQAIFKTGVGVGGKMTVTTNGNQDVVILSATKAEQNESMMQGFLVDMKDGTQRLYDFGFDKSGFGYTALSGLLAGNTRVQLNPTTFISWDGTGGGDIAPEALAKPYPNYLDKPWDNLSGNLYSFGKKFQLLSNTSIVGVGSAHVGDGLFALAVITVKSGTLTYHTAVATVDSGVVTNISYGKALASCAVEGKFVANVRDDMMHVLYGSYLLTLVATLQVVGSVSYTLNPVKAALNDKEEVVWSGFDDAGVAYATIKQTKALKNTYPAIVTNAFESPYGTDNTEPTGAVTRGSKGATYNYYDTLFTAPDRSETAYIGNYNDDAICTLLLKPILTFHGIYPTQTYVWMRTILVDTCTYTQELYWYKDYRSSDYVRCNWERDYVLTTQWNEYGPDDPWEGAVNNSTTVNVNGQKLVFESSELQHWFYTVANGAGDFVLRDEINGVTGRAMLVSKTGKTLIVDKTVSVNII